MLTCVSMLRVQSRMWCTSLPRPDFIGLDGASLRAKHGHRA